MSKRLIAAPIGVLAIAVLAAGCGSGGDSTETTAALTKQQFIKQGDAICKKGNAEIEEEFEAFAKKNDIGENEEPSNAQGKELTETILVPNVKSQSEEIRALGEPSSGAAEVTAMLDSLDEGVEEAEEEPEALFTSKSDPFAAANKDAKQYGFEVCGQE